MNQTLMIMAFAALLVLGCETSGGSENTGPMSDGGADADTDTDGDGDTDADGDSDADADADADTDTDGDGDADGDADGDSDADGDADTDADADGDADADADGDSDTDGDADTDADADGDADGDTDTECATVTDQADLTSVPVDIVFAVDNSGSMTEEAHWVQNNLNAFSGMIAASGVDYHIVLISADDTSDEGICVASPLGSGACPGDTNPPRYLHVVQTVSSSDSLRVINDTYDQWKDMLRPGAIRHFVVVSDDNSDDSGATFTGWMNGRGITDFTFHAIVASAGAEIALTCMTGGAHACCSKTFPPVPLGAARGTVYIQLANSTGGIWGDLCKQDFGPIFDELATVVSEVSFACEWEIPEPPAGEELDPTKVNIRFTDSGGGEHDIGHVDDPALCADVAHGWYYDDPSDPTKIIICGQTCEWIQDFEDGHIEIILGCETEPAIIV